MQMIRIFTTLPVKGVMWEVSLALSPVLLLQAWAYGLPWVWNLGVLLIACLGFEGFCLHLRSKDVLANLTDGSAVLCALLLAVALPAGLPVGGLLLASFMAIVLAKQVYGGLGQNLFNPAMVGYAATLLALPMAMTQWPMPFQQGMNWQVISGATVIDQWRTAGQLGQTLVLGEMSFLWFNAGAAILGGCYLLYRRLITWHVPAFLIGTVLCLGWLANYWLEPSLPWQYLLFGGQLFLVAFFFATDPVTAPSTLLGQIIFAVGIALIACALRWWGLYAEGWAFAILLMNMLCPVIDHFCHEVRKQ